MKMTAEDINLAVVAGRVIEREPVKYTSRLTPMFKMVIATAGVTTIDPGSEKIEVVRHHVVIIGNAAEMYGDCINVGDRVRVEGRIKTRCVENKGKLWLMAEIIAETVEAI